jgi:Ribonuclease G/E
LGGLVVIDFIDMDDYRNNFKVEKAIKSALYKIELEFKLAE